MSLDEAICLGCVYIYPTPHAKYDAMVILWVRSSHLELDSMLEITVKQWVRNDWPFDKVGFPGRDIGWETWLTDEDL